MTVSVTMGQNEYYPLYILLGNVHNNVCQSHWNAVSIIAFLSILKSRFVVLSIGFEIHFFCFLQLTDNMHMTQPSKYSVDSCSTHPSKQFWNHCILG